MAGVNGDLLITGFAQLVAATTPAPSPSAGDAPAIDPNRVTPGVWGFLSFVVLIIASVIIYFSLRKQLRKVNFDEDAPSAGTRDVNIFPARTSGPSSKFIHGEDRPNRKAGNATTDAVSADDPTSSKSSG